jgi:hypothetical protein
MTAAVMQGVLTNTMDVDIWVDLPTRQYIRLWNLIREQGGSALSQTLYVLEDGKVVNFLFSVDGLRRFAAEFKEAVDATIDGIPVKLLPLERVLQSKKTILRDKDQPHIRLIENVLKAKKKLAKKK